ncbi:MAG: hypothetical protein AAGH89_03960 [Verrucomicrobiota bacterium]
MLVAAYLANILILVPVAFSTLRSESSAGTVFEEKFPMDSPLRLLVGALWFGILVCSVIGLFRPNQMVAILILQVVYKATFLVLYIVPVWRTDGFHSVPAGITICFLAIVLIWPFLLWKSSPIWL